jgi:hypothetical protein
MHPSNTTDPGTPDPTPIQIQARQNPLRKVFSRENLLALLIALLLIAIYIATAADAPLWVYQGF